MANEAGGENFTKNDFEVFQSIAEQTAFALGNSIVHLEAIEKKNLEKELTTASEVTGSARAHRSAEHEMLLNPAGASLKTKLRLRP